MKKFFRFSFILMVISVALMLSGNNAFAQMKTWTWDTYRTKFDVPTDFQIRENNANKFEASNGSITMTIYPQNNLDLTYEQMVGNLNSWGVNNGVSVNNQPEYIDDLSGYWGVALDGQSGSYPVFLMLAIDPDFPDIGLYIWISYNEAYSSIAEAILMSFTPN